MWNTRAFCVRERAFVPTVYVHHTASSYLQQRVPMIFFNTLPAFSQQSRTLAYVALSDVSKLKMLKARTQQFSQVHSRGKDNKWQKSSGSEIPSSFGAIRRRRVTIRRIFDSTTSLNHETVLPEARETGVARVTFAGGILGRTHHPVHRGSNILTIITVVYLRSERVLIINRRSLSIILFAKWRGFEGSTR